MAASKAAGCECSHNVSHSCACGENVPAGTYRLDKSVHTLFLTLRIAGAVSELGAVFSIQNIASLALNEFQKVFQIRLRCCGVHAGEFQALASLDPRVADHGQSTIEKGLSDLGVDPIRL